MTPEIPKITGGRVTSPRDVVIKGFAHLVEQAGGLDGMRRLIDECDAVPEKALDLALQRSRTENMLATVGESQVAFAVLQGLFWVLLGEDAYSPSLELVVCLFLPTVGAVLLHLLIQQVWCGRWYEQSLEPALSERSPELAVVAAYEFYHVTCRWLTVPGTLLYPLTAVVTMALLDASVLAWSLVLPAATAAGWVINQWLYATRLFHTDLRACFETFGILLSAEDEERVRCLRRGFGLYRRVGDLLEARGYASLRPLAAYVSAQCALTLLAGLALVFALVAIEEGWQRLMVAVPVVPGLICITYSCFRRFSFLHKRPERRWVSPGEMTMTPSSLRLHTEFNLGEHSRTLRRAMP